MKDRFILAMALASLLLPAGNFSFAAEVAVVKSRDIKPYRIAISSFAKFTKAMTAEYNMGGRSNKGSEIISEITYKRPDLILSLGTKAAMLTHQNVRNIPTIFCMVSRPEKYKLIGENVAGVSLNIPARVQFETLKTILPDIKRIGVIYSRGESGRSVKKAGKDARELGLALVSFEVASEKEIPMAARSLKGRIDALWMIMDSAVVTGQSVKHLILFTIRNKIPFMGFSIRFVKEGALLALSGDYEDMGRQAGKLARQILKGNAPEGLHIVAPKKTRLILNLKTAKLIGIDFQTDVVRGADKIFE